MTSKEALEELYDGYQYGMAGRSFYDLVKQDLERLEELEDNETIVANYTFNLIQENEKLKKAIKILKDHVQFKLVPIVSNDPILEGAYHFGIKIDKYGYYATLPKIEAEVLKEVLENEL